MDQTRLRQPLNQRGHTLTEGQVAEELGLDRLELHLVAVEQRLGSYDPLTHLLMFSDAEVDALAQRMGVKRRRRVELSVVEEAKIPDPSGE